MTISHIDQLAEWWETAEKGGFRKGDTIITKDDDGYFVGTAGMSDPDPYDSIRVLARAPKPKPAWHDAAAVIAHTDDGHTWQVWERDGDTDYWCGTEGYLARTEKLLDVTPLIEAKVTDEMVLAALNKKWDASAPHLCMYSDDGVREMHALLTAALGLETT